MVNPAFRSNIPNGPSRMNSDQTGGKSFDLHSHTFVDCRYKDFETTNVDECVNKMDRDAIFMMPAMS